MSRRSPTIRSISRCRIRSGSSRHGPITTSIRSRGWASAEPADGAAGQDRAGEGARPDAKLADLHPLGELHVALEVAGGQLERGRVPQHQLAQHRRRHLALAAVEESGAEPGLERLDAAGEGGLGDVEALRGAREVAVLGERDGVPQLAELEGWRSCHSSIQARRCIGHITVPRQCFRGTATYL